MRAIWLPSIDDSLIHQISGEPFHHLVNVVRINEGEELLLLDGCGLQVRTVVNRKSKRDIELKEIERVMIQVTHTMDLALGIPKRDALELCLKQATEIGFRRIFLVRSEYSQIKVPEAQRVHNLLVSALEQSNAAFLPEIIECDWSQISWSEYGMKLMLDSQTEESKGELKKSSTPMLLVVGPEGGFSPREIEFLHSVKGMEVLNFPTPIMRTPTALAVGAGSLLQRLMDRR
jgi:16S rRNA (uracil1498-N3)-methyltransferase